MEYKNLEEMLEKFEFGKEYTGGGCFWYVRSVPESKPFSIVIFTNHNDKWLKQQANDPEISLDEIMKHYHHVEYDIYVCETELLYSGDDFPMYRADGVKPGHEWNTDWTKLQDHIQATIELSESLVLNPEYVEKYGCTHKQLLDKYRNLDVDEFKTLLMVYNMYAGVTIIDDRLTFD
tara:strand:+ start:89 stop:619 length:531 start_codon:yes stop_codon:yes gene_type:complete